MLKEHEFNDIILNPAITDTLSIAYKRKGGDFMMKSSPTLRKNRTSQVVEVKNISQEQLNYRKMFFGF